MVMDRCGYKRPNEKKLMNIDARHAFLSNGSNENIPDVFVTLTTNDGK